MKISAKIFAKGDKLYDCLLPEAGKFDRSGWSVKKTEGGVDIDITADDAVAFRATMNSICQLIIIYQAGAKNG